MRKLLFLVLCFVLLHMSLSAIAKSDDIHIADIPNNPYLTLINKENQLPADWNYRFEFAVGKNSLGELHIVEKKSLTAFEELRKELLEKENIQIELDSVYRSIEEQQEIWDAWTADPEKGLEYCEKYLAPVGCSEHHTGLAIDVFIVRPNGSIERENDEMLADYENFAMIHDYLAKHGFILRYLEGEESTTGYSYEPWHFRYIDDASIATYITENRITLEEYVKQNP